MIVDSLDALTSLTTSLNQLHAKSADKAKKGVIIDKDAGSKANPSQRVNPNLTTNEKSRYEKIFKIFKDVVDPGPEAARTSATARATKASRVSQPAAAAASDAKGVSKGILGTLGAIGAMLLAFGKTLWEAVKNGLKSALKGLWKFLKKGVSTMLKWAKGAIKQVGRTLMKSVKAAGKVIWKGLKATGKSILKAFKAAGSVAKKAMTKLFSGLMNSKPIQALKGAFGAAFDKLKGVLSSVKDTVMEKAKSIGGGIWNSVKGFTGRAFDGAKAIGSKAVGGIKAGASYVVDKGRQAGRFVGNKIIGPAKRATGKFLKGAVGSGGKGLLSLLRRFAKIPVIGPLVEGFLVKGDLEALKEKYNNREISLEQLESQAGRRVMTGLSGMAGASLGGVLGTMIPIPIVGSLIGAVGGDIAGRALGGVVADTVMSPYKRDVGRFALSNLAKGTPTAPMQDFIVQNGNVHSFSTRDSVLGMKPGGAIDRLITERDNSLNIQQAGVFSEMRQIGELQLQALLSIQSGIAALVARSGSSSSSTSVKLQTNQLTTDYYAS